MPAAFESSLRAALARAIAGVPERELARATEALVSRYRSPQAASEPILASRVHVAAYAAYRMPATTAAMRRVLGVVAKSGFAPEVLLDLGGGTGAAAWAAAETFPTLGRITVLDQVDDALVLGRSLVVDGPSDALRTTRFERAAIDRLPALSADLVTVSYVLSELTDEQQARLVQGAIDRGRVVAIAEPGTPDGYLRVLAARQQLLQAGWILLGPCPHELDCPLAQGDWCHFVARVSRSADHRRLKGAELSYEDEKFSWVAAASPGTAEPHGSSGRVLRHPLKRKGFVEFEVCRPDGTAGREVISKKAGDRYRAARDTDWGDELPD